MDDNASVALTNDGEWLLIYDEDHYVVCQMYVPDAGFCDIMSPNLQL